MKFIDTAELYIKAGKGGDGAVSFHHALFVPNGGPNGGDGGRGGSVIFVGDSGKNSLLDLKLQKFYTAENGEKGGIKNMYGAKGKDIHVKVPLGTLIYNKKTNDLIVDISKDKQEFIIAKGGKGGKGNAKFANSRNKAPTIFEAGELGEELEIRAELKVLADIGFIGKPNAGKSTLLRAISNSKPEVADYAFTTINPQLGVAKAKDNSTFVVADLPGLIKGASLGKGLGIQFLKHIERCKVICHVLDMSGNYGTEDVIKNYELIRKELLDYNLKLEDRREIIIANKIDLEEAQINLLDDKIIEYFKDKIFIKISSLKKENLDNLLLIISKVLKEEENKKPIWEIDDENVADKIKYYTFDEEAEEIIISNKGNGKWEVSGKTVFNIYQKFPIVTNDNLLIFNDKLRKINLYDKLIKRGIKKGDTVKIFDYEMEWVD